MEYNRRMSEKFRPEDVGRRMQEASLAERYGQGHYSVALEGLSCEYFEPIDLTIMPGDAVVVVSDMAEARAALVDGILSRGEGFEGKVHASNRTRFSLVEPESAEPDQLTIKDFYLSSRGLDGVEEKLMELYAGLGDNPDLADEIGKFQALMDDNNGWGAQNEIEQILMGLNIVADNEQPIDIDGNISDVSSGQYIKLALGRALYSKSDIVLLKDPDIHLDVPSRDWLISYIKATKQALVLATSDMLTAEEVATQVVEILNIGNFINIRGDMQTFSRERERIIKEWLADADRVRDEIDHLKNDVQRLRQAAQNSETLARRKDVQESKLIKLQDAYERMPGKRLSDAERSHKSLIFEIDEQGSQRVLSVPSINVSYRKQPDKIIHIPDFEIFKGQRVAAVGLNGSGKSTLMKVAFGVAPDQIDASEAITLGPSVVLGWYGPDAKLPNDGSLTLRNFLHEAKSKKSPGISEVLDFWGVDKNLLEKPMTSSLSHDVITRILFASLMLKNANFLALDEPTSYLSPKYKERLITALQGYKGTLLTISHDVSFLNAIGITDVLKMPDGKMESV